MVSVWLFTLRQLPLLKVSLLTFLFKESKLGGDDGIRTHDPLLAGQVLSQLSYTPIIIWFVVFSLSSVKEGSFIFPPTKDVGIELFSRTVSRKVSSPLQSLTSVFGMGTGGPSAFVAPTI